MSTLVVALVLLPVALPSEVRGLQQDELPKQPKQASNQCENAQREKDAAKGGLHTVTLR